MNCNYTFGEQRIRWLPDAEVRRLISMSSQPTLLETTYFYGLRRSEVGLIMRSDVEPQGIWIHALKRKGDFRQFMPMEGGLKKRILKHLMNHNRQHLFPGYSCKGISGGAVAHIWKQVAPGIGVHCLRHSRAMWFSENGMPIEDCSYWLRHSSIKSTESYYKISATRARSIAIAMA